MEARSIILYNLKDDQRFTTMFKMARIDALVVKTDRGMMPISAKHDRQVCYGTPNVLRDVDKAGLYDNRGNYGYFRFSDTVSFEVSEQMETAQLRAVFMLHKCSDIDAACTQMARIISGWQGCTITGRSIDRAAIFQSEAPENQKPAGDSVGLFSIDFTISTPININCVFLCDC